MASAANTAVREKRRRSSAQDIEKLNVLKALTAAEYSRRQFVLNYAASRSTQLLIPGRKSGAIKEAEEWVVGWLSQNGFGTVTNEFFKYMVDSRLWTTFVGDDIAFPFTFMHQVVKAPPSHDQSVTGSAHPSHQSETTLTNSAVEDSPQQRRGSNSTTTKPPSQHTTSSVKQPTQPQPPSFTAGKKSRPEDSTTTTTTTHEKKRSLSLNSIDDLKWHSSTSSSKKANTNGTSQDKFPFLMRLSRSWSQRLAS
ncbi:hypothetical protein B0T22DRAFT_40790 [Podospora appendiculata]|uniref:Uncharacterized protein n=1 Tax=Podospora appendiculata TaxID=314037 RepID=A0AAE0XHQ0_9PEZI|nr:hypothetical protein B0T22DRAFT_40790 [Podospora appendiculata]